VNEVRVDYSDNASLVSTLKGHDFLAITLSVTAPPTLHSEIVKAAVDAGIPYIMPNTYGSNPLNENLRKDLMYSQMAYNMFKEVTESGAIAISMACSFWYEWSLALGEQFYGFSIKDRKVTFFDDGNTKICTSTWDLCGAAFAALLSLPVEKEGDGPAVSDWKNKPLYISSFTITQRDMLESLNRVLGTTDKDWEIKYEPSDKRVKDGNEEFQKGDRRGFAKAMYSRMFFPNGDGNFETEIVNDVLGLPKEDLDEATKRVIEELERPVPNWLPSA
jgi:hypothetical protein